jgi:hypothetical protein
VFVGLLVPATLVRVALATAPLGLGTGVGVTLGVGVGVAVLGTGMTTVTSTSRVSISRTITVCMAGTWIGGNVTNTGVCVDARLGGVVGRGRGVIGVDSVVVVSDSAEGVDVGMLVGCGNSGSVSVFVIVGEGSSVVVAVSVIEGSAVIVACGLGLVGGVGVNVGEGEGVGVRHVPGVARVRYCGHSSSCIFRSRSPPGRLSQIA